MKNISPIISLLIRISSFLLIAFLFFAHQMNRKLHSKSSFQLKIEEPKSKVERAIHGEQLSYAIKGNFSTNLDEYLTGDEKDSTEYSIKVTASQNKQILSVYDSSNRLPVAAFGVIKIIKSEPSTNINKNGYKWKYLEILAFACEREAGNTSSSSSLDIAKLNDKCPTGYIQTYKKQENYIKNLSQNNINK